MSLLGWTRTWGEEHFGNGYGTLSINRIRSILMTFFFPILYKCDIKVWYRYDYMKFYMLY